jgi:hypothetical protein
MTCRFDVDRVAIAQAGELLGLEHPVRVFVRAYAWGEGRYIAFKDGEHRIGVAADLPPRNASQVLWHELTHAQQVERLGGETAFDRLWCQQMRDMGLTRLQAARATGRRYRRAALEVEAEANERRHRELALVRSREGRFAALISWRLGT